MVCPIFKAGNKSSPSNYRPISLLSTLSKLLEKLIKKRVIKYLEKYNYLHDNQYGFREGRSTEDAVLKFSSLVTRYLDDGQRCLSIFLDLQKAFDTVSIPILLTRLENVGIRGTMLNWFEDYLSSRTQRVRVEDYESESAVCSFGVPQGSTLGPVLFLIYINELCNTCTGLEGLDLLMFADDTVLLLHDKTWPQVTKLAEKCLARVTVWLEDSLLSLNTDKTKYICFSKSDANAPKLNPCLKIHTYPCNRNITQVSACSCTSLSRVNKMKYLGVIIDDRLNWNSHIQTLASRIRRLIYAFKNLREVAEHNLIMQVYRALCECLIRYCICAWGSAAKTHIITAERAQRAVLKVLLRRPFRHPTTALYNEANVLSVRKLFIYESIRRFHKNVAPTLPSSTKRIDQCPVPWVRSRFAQRRYDVVVPKLYNMFNKKYKIKQMNNNTIKKAILTWLQGLDYDGIECMLSNMYF